MILLYFFAVLLFVAVVACIAYPLLRPRHSVAAASSGETEELLLRRDRLYGELRELDFDYRVGKITPEDYGELRRQLENDAARILQAIDVEIKEIDDEIEREIGHLRETSTACPSCGAAITPGARFCAACGATLKAAARR
ncbi:MAG TPA: zinc ribbon domain-containing protein [Chloroflexota bacterium]|nr:zinc ribbon domain-containing protein [Chloroflexota bacterium]